MRPMALWAYDILNALFCDKLKYIGRQMFI